nr:hypothetical protein K-LCC10_0292 [Kaumoebavirus]
MSRKIISPELVEYLDTTLNTDVANEIISYLKPRPVVLPFRTEYCTRANVPLQISLFLDANINEFTVVYCGDEKVIWGWDDRAKIRYAAAAKADSRVPLGEYTTAGKKKYVSHHYRQFLKF